jgi:hypothetical protein
MTHYILRRSIQSEAIFHAAVEAYINELKAYEVHMLRVRAGQGQPYPPPAAFPDVDKAVKRSITSAGLVFEPDYNIVDFLPVTYGDAKALEERKQELIQLISNMEQATIYTIIPRRKWRLVSLEYNAANSKPEAQRTTSDNETIVEGQARIQEMNNIQLHFARLEATIDDLTYDTINDWKPMPYTKGS